MSHMWDLRRWAKLQKCLQREGHESHMRSTFGTTIIHFPLLLAPSSCVRLQEHAQNLHVRCDTLWNSNPKASICQVCVSWNTFTKARWVQSILIAKKCPHSIIKNLKWDQMGLWHKSKGAALFWMWDGPQPLPAGRRGRVSESGSSLRSSSAPGVQKAGRGSFLCRKS